MHKKGRKETCLIFLFEKNMKKNVKNLFCQWEGHDDQTQAGIKRDKMIRIHSFGCHETIDDDDGGDDDDYQSNWWWWWRGWRWLSKQLMMMMKGMTMIIKAKSEEKESTIRISVVVTMMMWCDVDKKTWDLQRQGSQSASSERCSDYAPWPRLYVKW